MPANLQGKIVFTCQLLKDSRYNQICMMNPDGSNHQRLTTEDAFDHIYPSLAPDGQSVVFSSNQTGGYEIYSLDWSGNQVQLTDEQQAGTAGAFAPEISPDGQSLVYARVLSDSDKSIWISDRAGGQARWVFGTPGAGGWDPSWSPDGSRILFMSDRTGSNQLHTIAVDGSDLKQITDLEDLRGRNDWSPDGSVVATYIGKPWLREVVLMDADGSNLRYLTKDGNNLAPSFSPDGGWVAVTSYKDLYQDNNGCEIYILRMDGSDMRRLTDNDYCDWQPRWGP
jgi:TolB protein